MTRDRCQHVKDDGERCGVTFGLSDNGFCLHHDPERIEEAQAARKRGGEATAKKLRKSGLDADDLPPLTSHEAAEIWTDRIGRAAATGSLPSSAAQAALRAVREWRESHESGEVSNRLESLLDALAEWRKTGDPEPVLTLVKGGDE